MTFAVDTVPKNTAPKSSPKSINGVAWIAALIAAVVAVVLILGMAPLGSPWQQNYDPTGHWWLSTLIAALPIVVLLGTLALLHIKAHYAALLGLATALATAVLVFHMPGRLAATTAVYGAGYGLFPIGWIILNVIFMYQLTVESGRFKVLQHSMTGITQDRRLQLLLIAFCFGAFFEGAAGFGTPVAVTAALLIGLGFKPLQASGLSLIANTAPVAFGALGTPIIALAKVTGMSEIHARCDGWPHSGAILHPGSVLADLGVRGLLGNDGDLAGHPGCGGVVCYSSTADVQLSRTLGGEHRCRRGFHDLPDWLSVHLASEEDLDLRRRGEQGRPRRPRVQPLGSCACVDTVGHPQRRRVRLGHADRQDPNELSRESFPFAWRRGIRCRARSRIQRSR